MAVDRIVLAGTDHDRHNCGLCVRQCPKHYRHAILTFMTSQHSQQGGLTDHVRLNRGNLSVRVEQGFLQYRQRDGTIDFVVTQFFLLTAYDHASRFSSQSAA